MILDQATVPLEPSFLLSTWEACEILNIMPQLFSSLDLLQIHAPHVQPFLCGQIGIGENILLLPGSIHRSTVSGILCAQRKVHEVLSLSGNAIPKEVGSCFVGCIFEICLYLITSYTCIAPTSLISCLACCNSLLTGILASLSPHSLLNMAGIRSDDRISLLKTF